MTTTLPIHATIYDCEAAGQQAAMAVASTVPGVSADDNVVRFQNDCYRLAPPLPFLWGSEQRDRFWSAFKAAVQAIAARESDGLP